MSHLSVYIITLAADAEDAKSEVESWLDDYANREFFDYGSIEEPEKVVLLSEIRKELEEKKAEAESALPSIEIEIQRYKESGNRRMEGFSHKRYGAVLDEDLCSDMPFFNIENWDWSIPTEIPTLNGDTEGMEWYAVMVDLHC